MAEVVLVGRGMGVQPLLVEWGLELEVEVFLWVREGSE